MTVSVAIVGASGRMGSLARNLVDQSADLKLHAALGSKSDLQELLGADVVLDFTLPDISPKIVDFAISNQLKIVVGTSGWSSAKIAGLEKKISDFPNAGVLIVPNFSVGSMLAQKFAAMAAKYFESIEIIEAHHAGKVDSPSGTAIRTAEQIAKNRPSQPLVPGVGQQARGEIVSGVPIHSLRLTGVAAKQEVIFGGNSELLTITHEVSTSNAYAHGILLALHAMPKISGIQVGLESIVGD